MARMHLGWALPLALVAAVGLGACGPSGNAGPVGDGGGSRDAASGDLAVEWDAEVYDGNAGRDGIEGCNPKSFTLQQSPSPEIYLVVDRSGSMSEPGSDPALTKWQELKAAVDTALTQFESVIKFGVLTYPANTECNTSGPQVKFDLYNRTAINGHLDAQTPAGGTPTAAALTNAMSSLRSLGTPGSPKFVILATDGGPNCNYFLTAAPTCSCSLSASQYCCTAHPATCYFGQNCLDDTHTLQVLADLRTQGIDTFVIGLAGTGFYAQLLDQMAVAGGRPNSGTTYYFAANNQAELQAALQAIAVSVISCKIDLQEAPELPDGVLVYMDGVEVPRDQSHAYGWDYTDSTNMTIEFRGPTCDVLQDGQQHDVVATFPCLVF